ncbi:hypothetical protein K32_38330 [Kaistia sp. 32K]|nr:hypothetical protein K32_38330 [Kaistia sp. 32K]
MDRNAGIVDEDVKTAKTLDNLPRQRVGRPFVPHVGGDEVEIDAGARQNLGRILDRSASAYDDAGTRLPERLGNGEANAARAAGDEGNLPIKPELIEYQG